MGPSKVVYEGWMVRYGRRKIGRSFIHKRYFVLESRLLAYYKQKPQDNQVPIKTLVIDGNCRVEDRGLKTHHGHMVYVLCVYNKKDKYHRITMAAFNIQEALIWKEKIELVIDQHQESQVANGNKYISFEYKSGSENVRIASSSDHESQLSAQEEDEEEAPHNLLRRKTIGNGPPEAVFDWTQELDTDISYQNTNIQAFSRKQWRLLQCQNGLRIFEELSDVDYLPRSCSRAMRAVGVVEATCEEIFELLMTMDGRRFEWDCSFQCGSLVEEVDGHTAVIYHRLLLDWFPMFVWPRDLCYVRYWRRNDDGSYVVLFRSRQHENCGPQPGFVRAHLESGGFNLFPLKPQNGIPRTKVQHLMQIDLKGWGVGYISSFQQHCLLQMLNSVAGLREYFSQTDERTATPRIPVMVNMTSSSASSTKGGQKLQESSVQPGPLDQMNGSIRPSAILDEYSDEDEDFQVPETEEGYPSTLENEVKKSSVEEELKDQIDLSCFMGILRRDDHANARNCWSVSEGNNFKVRSKKYCYDKSKVPAGKHLMDLVAVDWFKDTKRMDHVARRQGCVVQVASDKGLFSLAVNLQVPGSTHYSMVFYFVAKKLIPGSLLQRFVDGDDEFRNSRLKLIPSVPKGSWIVRQSVGSTPCLLGKAVDCNYIRGPDYLEIDVDIGSSTVANGVLGLVIGVITTLVVDMAFLVQHRFCSTITTVCLRLSLSRPPFVSRKSSQSMPESINKITSRSPTAIPCAPDGKATKCGRFMSKNSGAMPLNKRKIATLKTSVNPRFVATTVSGDSNASINFDVRFPNDYSELIEQAREATELACMDNIQLMEIEFPTAGLESVPGDGEGGTEMTESMQLIREFCDRFISPEKARRTRIFFPEASEVKVARKSAFGGVSFKLDYLTKPSLFEDFGFVTKVKMADRVKPEDELFLVAYPYFNVNEMLVVEELYIEAVANTGRKLIIFNGELDRIRSGYYPAFFYPKLAALSKTLFQKMETVYYIHNFKGRSAGTLFSRCYPGPWKVLRKLRNNKYVCIHEQEAMPSLKEVALDILPSA